MKKVVLVEDNRMFLKHLTEMLEGSGHFRLAAAFQDAFEAERFCRTGGVDLILMDVQTLHNHSGLAAGKRIREACPGLKVVIVTSLIDPEVLQQARRGCADSLWYKDHGDAEILDVMERTLAGEHVFPAGPPEVEIKDMSSAEITPRQMDILRRFVIGMTYDEIARELKLTKNGVRWNLDQIVEKGGFRNKHELLIAAIENKLIVTTLSDE